MRYKDEAWLREQYWEKKLTMRQMAELADCGQTTILFWMDRFNIPRRHSHKLALKTLYRDKEWLYEQYFKNQLNIVEMGEMARCEPSTICSWMDCYGLERRSMPEVVLLKDKPYFDKDWLHEKYWEERLSIPQIAEVCNVHQKTISRWMWRLDVPRRSRSEVTKIVMEDDEVRRSTGNKKRKYHWNEHFFDKLTPDSAYVIGFITADGSLGNLSSRAWYDIIIVQKERDILDKISELMCYDGNFHKGPDAFALHLWSEHAYNTLNEVYEIPIGKGKSYTVQVPKVILGNHQVLPHYIRGIFDGDGCVDKYGRGFSFYSGSYDLLDGICNILVNYCGLEQKEPKWSTGGYIKTNGEMSGSYYISWWRDNPIPFAQYIYGENLDVFGSNLFIEAKRARFELAFRQ